MKTKKYFLKQLSENITGFTVNGSVDKSVGNILNVSFAGVDGEAVLMLLDLAGIAVSNGSACASGSVQNSHVITAINPNGAKGAVRFSFSYLTTLAEIDYTIEELKKALANLRKLSPVKTKGVK